eukprot:CAMPEP_0198139138 /NCGR_PEP_ID=MMETSP1443-20131203/2482_1 /TAXON_ID=186043 /ORGANISM="Entomoneis sp., Strain CCMP2396" /LENGTH=263 /DNA_ID=CAMNT_0043801181 /DNA_START=42 /DNA_END=830 /DNA_ORIENTATION=+
MSLTKFSTRLLRNYDVSKLKVAARGSIRSLSENSKGSPPMSKKRDALHKDVLDTLGKKSVPKSSPPPTEESDRPRGVWEQIQSDKARKTRFEQAMVNSFLTFGVVVMAAQNLKIASEKRKVETELKATQLVSEERLALLQSMFTENDQTVDTIAQRLVSETTMIPSSQQDTNSKSSGWFRSTTPKEQPSKNGDSDVEQQQQQQQLKAVCAKIVEQELYKTIGEQSLDNSQQEAIRMRLFATSEEEGGDSSPTASEGSLPEEAK